MPSKTKPLTAKQLRDFEATRDLGAELLASVRQMKAGKTKVILSRAGDVPGREDSSRSADPPPSI